MEKEFFVNINSIKHVYVYYEDTLFTRYIDIISLIPEKSYFFGLIKKERILRFYRFPDHDSFFKEDYKGSEIDEILNGKEILSPGFKDKGFVELNEDTGFYNFITKPHITITYNDEDYDTVFDTPKNLKKIIEELREKCPTVTVISR